MNEVNEFVNAALSSISRIARKCIDKAEFDKTYAGIITKVISENNYEVKIGAGFYAVPSSTMATYVVMDKVWVTAPQNRFSDIFICGSRN